MALLRRLWNGGPAKALSPSKPVAPATKPATAATALPFTIRTLSDWNAGYCVDVVVRNSTKAAVDWRVDPPVEGETTQVWSAVRDGKGFRGADWNRTLAAGKSASFGFCALRSVQASAPVAALAKAAKAGEGFEIKTAVESDWRAGYCLRVFVRNRSSSAAAWEVRLPMPDRLRETWKARVRLEDGQLIAGGEEYNVRLAPGEATDFGFCAVR
jgi:cellulase/cellobiase CelA1